MQEYLVRTCLRCNYSFKSKADAVHIRCSNCGSVKVVNALEMPAQLSQDIEINRLKEVMTSMESRFDSMTSQFIEHGAEQSEMQNRVTKRLNNHNARLKSLGV